MSRKGPIIYVEDDLDDVELFMNVMKELHVHNKIFIFNNSREAMDFLCETREQPFLIICDVNLPGQNGLDFKHSIDQNPYLRKKSIPFIFYSTSVSQQSVNYAYTQMTVQGFFPKESNYNNILNLWRTIISYWQQCYHPNT